MSAVSSVAFSKPDNMPIITTTGDLHKCREKVVKFLKTKEPLKDQYELSECSFGMLYYNPRSITKVELSGVIKREPVFMLRGIRKGTEDQLPFSPSGQLLALTNDGVILMAEASLEELAYLKQENTGK